MYTAMYGALGEFVKAARPILEGLFGISSDQIPAKLEEISTYLMEQGVPQDQIDNIANMAQTKFGGDFNEGTVEQFIGEAGMAYVGYLSQKMQEEYANYTGGSGTHTGGSTSEPNPFADKYQEVRGRLMSDSAPDYAAYLQEWLDHWVSE